LNNSDCLNFEILDIVRANRKKTYFPQKNIGSYLLSIRLEGETVFMCADKNFTLNRNDVFFVPIGSKYSQYDNTDVEFVCFHLEIHSGAPEKMIIVKPHNESEIRRLFIDAARVWKERKPGYGYECMAMLYSIFAGTIAPVIAGKEENENIIGKSIAFLNSHIYDCDLSLADVCDKSNVSRVYFNRVFLKQFKTTPVKYINHKRIEKAKLLLKSGSFAREEIAFLCGFKDIKYFYTVFKSLTGITTGEYCKTVKT